MPPTSHNGGGVRTPATPKSTTAVEVTLPASNQTDKSVVDKPVQTSTPRRAFKKPQHNEDTAHLFNNAGNVIPSIVGIDPVTERLFDKGLIMSLRPSRAPDGYYPNGELKGGSFIIENSDNKKRKRDDGI